MNECLLVRNVQCCIMQREIISMLLCVVLQECTMKVQEGKFKLQDLLVVPMQRVLKYHLLLKVGAISQLQNFNTVKFKPCTPTKGR